MKRMNGMDGLQALQDVLCNLLGYIYIYLQYIYKYILWTHIFLYMYIVNIYIYIRTLIYTLCEPKNT